MSPSLYIDWSLVIATLSLALAVGSLLRAEQAIAEAKEANKLTRENALWSRQAKIEIVPDIFGAEIRMPQKHDGSRDESVYFTLRNSGPATMRNLRCSVTLGSNTSPVLVKGSKTLLTDELLECWFPMDLPIPWPKGAHQKVPANYPDSDVIRLEIQYSDDSDEETQLRRCFQFTQQSFPWPDWRAQPVNPCPLV